jgi:hypothetical protein
MYYPTSHLTSIVIQAVGATKYRDVGKEAVEMAYVYPTCKVGGVVETAHA